MLAIAEQIAVGLARSVGDQKLLEVSAPSVGNTRRVSHILDEKVVDVIDAVGVHLWMVRRSHG